MSVGQPLGQIVYFCSPTHTPTLIVTSDLDLASWPIPSSTSSEPHTLPSLTLRAMAFGTEDGEIVDELDELIVDELAKLAGGVIIADELIVVQLIVMDKLKVVTFALIVAFEIVDGLIVNELPLIVALIVKMPNVHKRGASTNEYSISRYHDVHDNGEFAYAETELLMFMYHAVRDDGEQTIIVLWTDLYHDKVHHHGERTRLILLLERV